MIDYLKEFEDKGFFTCADILNESERQELLSNIDQIERNVPFPGPEVAHVK